MDASDIIINSGFTKSLVTVKLEEKSDVIRSLVLHNTLIQCIPELEQLKRGLSTFNFLNIMRVNMELISPLFVKISQKLTAGVIVNLKH